MLALARMACAALLLGSTVAASLAARGEPGAAAASATSFPEASGPLWLDRRIALHVPRGETLTLVSLRFAPAAGRTEAVNTIWCGVTIEARDTPPAPLIAVGEGATEAVSCDGLEAAGTMPPGDDGAPRIALLYRTHSPNAAGITPVVLAKNLGEPRGWGIDDAMTARVSELPGRPTLGRLRQALAKAPFR